MEITRRDFIKTVGLAMTAIAVPSCKKSTPPSTTKPNIIFILADDLGYADIGCYGQEKINTPNIDVLAKEGMRFTQHYAGSTVCAPSRCALMTGLHTGHCEIRGNKSVKPEGQYPLTSEALTVAELLKRSGYITGAAGKWGLGAPGTTGIPSKQGFDHFFGYNCQGKAHFFYPTQLWSNDNKVAIPENYDDAKNIYSHDLIAEDALEFIEKNQKVPFFLYLPFTIPHAELAVPDDSLKEYLGKFPEKPYVGRHYGSQESPRATYAGMVSRMDRDIGRILSLLKKLELDKNTIVFFSSDNGPHEEGGNDPNFFNSNGLLRGIKRDLYEGGIRVPLIARWPGQIEPGSVSNHVSAFWDFLPTCCDLAGIKPPEQIDGISILPTLLGKEQPEHEYLYWEFHERGGKQAVRLGEWKGVRLNVQSNPNSAIELYNLAEDISEEHDVAAQNPEIVEKIISIMKRAHIESEVFPFIS